MQPVEIVPIPGGTLVLRARGSELLILAHHVSELKGKKEARDFTSYFLGDALLNRPARKLFEAWLRKDETLWKRIYHTIQKEMTDVEASAGSAKSQAKAVAPAIKPATASKVVETAKENKKAAAEKPAKAGKEKEATPAKVQPKKAEKSDAKKKTAPAPKVTAASTGKKTAAKKEEKPKTKTAAKPAPASKTKSKK